MLEATINHDTMHLIIPLNINTLTTPLPAITLTLNTHSIRMFKTLEG